jgi:dipeptidyl aminopeptidase/acylaminoacyl peptidase
MNKTGIETETFMLQCDGIALRVFVATPQAVSTPLPSVQIHHGGGGYEQVYEHMAVEMAQRGFAGITMIHRGYPGSQGQMEYGGGEITDIGRLTEEIAARSDIDEDRMGIMGYSRGAHNALLAVERHDYFRAGALWSVPVDMVDHVQVNPWIAEMFGGPPDDVPEAYRIRSAIYFVDRISCPLLLLHGESDEVIPVRHSQRLARAMEELHKPFELKVFENEGHIWSPTAFHNNWQLTTEFFDRQLNPPG